jgi:FtsZ-binding cell division protein ZapB
MGNMLMSDGAVIGCCHTYRGLTDQCTVSLHRVKQREVSFSCPNTHSIKKIDFSKCEFLKFPSAHGVIEHLKNLRAIIITQSVLPELTKNDLKGYDCLTMLTITSCNLEYLPGDLFENTPNLERVNFSQNQIRYIANNILDPLKNLKFFDLRSNPSIDAVYNCEEKSGTLPTFDFLKAIEACKMGSEKYCRGLECKCCKHAEKIQELMLRCEELKESEEKHAIEIKDWVNKYNDLEKKQNDTVDESKNWEEKFKALEENYNELKDQYKELDKKSKASENWEEKYKVLEEEIEKKAAQEKLDLENLNDFTIKTATREFKINKIIIAAKSTTIAKLIQEDSDAACLEFKNISEQVIEAIIFYLQNGKLPETEVNLNELYAASRKLQIDELLKITRDLMFEKVDPKTALDVLLSCDKFSLDQELKMKAFKEFGKNFPDKKIDISFASNLEKLKGLMKEKLGKGQTACSCTDTKS